MNFMQSALISISEDGLLQLWDTEWRAERRARLVQQFAVNEGCANRNNSVLWLYRHVVLF